MKVGIHTHEQCGNFVRVDLFKIFSGGFKRSKAEKARKAYRNLPQVLRDRQFVIPVVGHILSRPDFPFTEAEFEQLIVDVNLGLAANAPHLQTLAPALASKAAPAGLQFRLLSVSQHAAEEGDYDFERSLNPVRGGKVPELPTFQLNIVASPMARLNGQAAWPLSPANVDALVFSTASESFVSTLLHEMGHYLGLHHLWDTNFSELGFNPPAGPDVGCPSSPNPNERYCNYLNYTKDPCRCMFSQDQVDTMRGCLLGYRVGLVRDQVDEAELRLINSAMAH